MRMTCSTNRQHGVVAAMRRRNTPTVYDNPSQSGQRDTGTDLPRRRHVTSETTDGGRSLVSNQRFRARQRGLGIARSHHPAAVPPVRWRQNHRGVFHRAAAPELRGRAMFGFCHSQFLDRETLRRLVFCVRAHARNSVKCLTKTKAHVIRHRTTPLAPPVGRAEALAATFTVVDITSR